MASLVVPTTNPEMPRTPTTLCRWKSLNCRYHHDESHEDRKPERKLGFGSNWTHPRHREFLCSVVRWLSPATRRCVVTNVLVSFRFFCLVLSCLVLSSQVRAVGLSVALVVQRGLDNRIQGFFSKSPSNYLLKNVGQTLRNEDRRQ